MTNFEISRYDVKSILDSATLPIGAAAKRLKDVEQSEMSQRTEDTHNIGLLSHFTDGISSYGGGGGAHHGWPSLAFQQAQPLNMHYPYASTAAAAHHHHQRLWCKQEQQHDNGDVSHGIQDIHQLQLGYNTHNNSLQPSVIHNLMGLDSSSMELSYGAAAVNGDGGNNNGGGGFVMMPIGQEGTHHQTLPTNAFGENEVKPLGYSDNMFGSSSSPDPYNQERSFYLYNSQQPPPNAAAATCINWVPTAVSSITTRAGNMAAVCHAAPATFPAWNDT